LADESGSFCTAYSGSFLLVDCYRAGPCVGGPIIDSCGSC
jgi:hypothetical protein